VAADASASYCGAQRRETPSQASGRHLPKPPTSAERSTDRERRQLARPDPLRPSPGAPEPAMRRPRSQPQPARKPARVAAQPEAPGPQEVAVEPAAAPAREGVPAAEPVPAAVSGPAAVSAAAEGLQHPAAGAASADRCSHSGRLPRGCPDARTGRRAQAYRWVRSCPQRRLPGPFHPCVRRSSRAGRASPHSRSPSQPSTPSRSLRRTRQT
jgi:hypothetical protein